ncbi:MAG: hypothetical protein VB029_09345, partial [Anaerolineaceae bacterium]|nr:hypothetical protein [Anaerolineaceae bacterium]
MTKALDALIASQLKAANSFTILSHIRPDGDAIGSLLGLAQGLRLLGKTVQCVLQDGAAEKYAHL